MIKNLYRFTLGNQNFIFLSLLVFLPLVKLININQGIISTEPDEANHVELVRTLSYSLIPRYFGLPFFFGPPLFAYLGIVVNFFLHDEFLSVRIVSLLMSIATSVVIFYYLSSKTNQVVGLIGGLTYNFLPLIVFYSRLGLIETTLAFFSFLFLYLFDLSISSKQPKHFLLSGFVLGLALLTKLTALTLFIIPGVYLVLQIFQSVRKKEKINYLPMLTILVGLFTPLPILIFYYLSEHIYFKDQVLYILSYGTQTPSLLQIINSSEKLTRMYTWPVVGLALIGFIWTIRSPSYRVFVLSFITLSLVLIKNPLSVLAIRYHVYFAAWWAVLSSLGIYYLYRKLPSILLVIILLTLTLTLTIPFSYQAYLGSSHKTVRNVSEYLINNAKNQWVFYNYWPTTFVVYTNNYKSAWLTADLGDTQAFANFRGSKFEKLDETSLSFLRKNGGTVVIQEPYSFEKPSSRYSLSQVIPQRGTKLAEFRSDHTFYPYLHGEEVFRVYKITPADISNLDEKDYAY